MVRKRDGTSVSSLKSMLSRRREVEDLGGGSLWSGARVLEFQIPGRDHFKVMAVPRR